MKLARVQLYTVNYHGAAALDESVVVWSESAWDAARSFVATFPRDGAKVVHVMHPDADENFRIDPEPESVTAGWVPGKPPKDEKWYLVRWVNQDGDEFAGVARWTGIEFSDSNFSYTDVYSPITHHNPTPISLETP